MTHIYCHFCSFCPPIFFSLILSLSRSLTCVNAIGKCSSKQQLHRQLQLHRLQQWPEIFQDPAVWGESPLPSVSLCLCVKFGIY